MGTQQSGYSAEWKLSRVGTQQSGYSVEWELSRVGTEQSGCSRLQPSSNVKISGLTLVVATKGVPLCFSELQALHHEMMAQSADL